MMWPLSVMYMPLSVERDVALPGLRVVCVALYVAPPPTGHPAFCALPTYAIVAAHPCNTMVPMEAYLPGFHRVGAGPHRQCTVAACTCLHSSN